MEMQWRITTGAKESKSARKGNGSKFSLAVFGGKCYNCGQVGHYANQFPNKKKGEGNGGNGGNGEGRKRFEGKCRLCGKSGHKAANFWNDEKMHRSGQEDGKGMEKQ